MKKVAKRELFLDQNSWERRVKLCTHTSFQQDTIQVSKDLRVHNPECLKRISNANQEEVLFVYEKPILECQKYKKSELLAKLDQRRIQDKTDCLYFVFQDKYQVGCAKSLKHPHYQVTKQEVISFLTSYHGNRTVDVVIIGFGSFYKDNYIAVLNSASPIGDIAFDVFDELKKFVKLGKKDDPLKRQQRHVDLGFCGVQSRNRNRQCPFGLVKPNILLLSRTKEGIRALDEVPNVQAVISEALELPHDIFHDDIRNFHFGFRLGTTKKCKVEATRTCWTKPSDTCNIHIDGQNGDEDGFREVLWASQKRLVNGVMERQSQILYSRMSAEWYLRHLKKHGQYLRICKSVYRSCPSRWFVEKFTNQYENFEPFPGVPMGKDCCNFQVESFYQPFVASIVKLAEAFDLDFRGCVSVFIANLVAMHSGVYSVSAATLLLAYRNRYYQKDIGLSLLSIMSEMDQKGSLFALPVPLRMSKRWKYVVPEQWNSLVDKIAIRLLRIRRFPPSQKRYDAILQCLRVLPNVGELFANHGVGVLSLLGLVDPLYFEMYRGGACKAYKVLKKKMKKTIPDKKTVLENMRHMMVKVASDASGEQNNLVVGRLIHDRYGENGACKIGRILGGSDHRWWDCWDRRFPFVLYVGKGQFALWGKKDGIVPIKGPLLALDPKDYLVRVHPELVRKARQHFKHVKKLPWMKQFLSVPTLHK